MGRLDGKVALISGGARGQGAAEARLFVAEGARVVLGDVLDEEGEAVARSLGDDAVYHRHDVRLEDGWRTMVDLARERFGRLDVLINNAGVLLFRSLMETTLDDYMHIIEINQVGCFLGMRAVVPAMQDAGSGSIVNVSSAAGLTGSSNLIAYVASKFAIRGMTKTAALELGRFGIRVNSIHPGGVATRMNGLDDAVGREPAGEDATFGAIPLGRVGSTDEIARLALFLASDESSYSTGSEFVADGGLLAGQGEAPRGDEKRRR